MSQLQHPEMESCAEAQMETQRIQRLLSEMSDTDRAIPFSSVPHTIRHDLAVLLEPGGYWKKLADKLDYTSIYIDYFDTKNHGYDDRTKSMLSHYSTTPHSTVENVLKALVKIKRYDAFDVLFNALRRCSNRPSSAGNHHPAALLTPDPMGHMVITDPKTYYGGHHSDVEYSSEPTDLRTVGQPHMDPTLEIKEEYVQSPLQTAPFKRGSRAIRIFITYANDDDKHMNRVLRLRDWLRNEKLFKNTFSVSLDESEEILVQGWDAAKDWMKTRYTKADFVLVCISPKYESDILPFSGAENSIRIPRLNTRFIYEMIESEMRRADAQPHRIIPLVFTRSGATKHHVPPIFYRMQRYMYLYPDHFRHLVQHLEKLDELIMKMKRKGEPGGGT